MIAAQYHIYSAVSDLLLRLIIERPVTDQSVDRVPSVDQEYPLRVEFAVIR